MGKTRSVTGSAPPRQPRGERVREGTETMDRSHSVEQQRMVLAPRNTPQKRKFSVQFSYSPDVKQEEESPRGDAPLLSLGKRTSPLSIGPVEGPRFPESMSPQKSRSMK